LERHNILIIDDDLNIRKLLADLLSGRPKYQVFFAANAAEAMNYLTGEKISVVLTDIHMPGLSGLELMADLGKLHYKPEILVMTANASDDNLNGARTIGARSLILKPFEELDAIEAEIEKAVEAAVTNEMKTGGKRNGKSNPGR
jgi:CheY-like chemotaxis protein